MLSVVVALPSLLGRATVFGGISSEIPALLSSTTWQLRLALNQEVLGSNPRRAAVIVA